MGLKTNWNNKLKNPLNHRKDYRLSYRLLLYIMVCSSIFTIVGTCIQLYFDYKIDMARIDEAFNHIEQGYLQPIASNLWKMDNPQLRKNLQGALTLRDIEYLEVNELRKAPDVIIEKAGAKKNGNTISKTFYLEIDGKKKIGTLQVIASKDAVIDRLKDKVFLILMTQTFKTFFVSICILLIFYSLIMKHLNFLTKSFMEFNFDRLDTIISINRRTEPSHPDEFGRLINSINLMRTKLRQNIEKRVQSENALKKSKERYAKLFNSGNDAVFVHQSTDNEFGHFTEINDVACFRLKYSREELLQMTPRDIDANEMGSKRSVQQNLLENGQQIFEMLHVDRSGNKIPVEISSSMFEDEGAQYVMSIARDITEKKQTEESLREFKYIVSSSHDMMAMLDTDFIYHTANDAYLKAFDKEREDIIGHSVSEVFGDEFFKNIIKSKAEDCMMGHSVRYSEWFDFPAQGRQYMDVEYSPYLDNGKNIIGFVVNARNNTEYKLAEEEKHKLEIRLRQAQKMEAIGTLAGGIAHDFNNILSPILGFTEMLQEDLPQDSREQKSVSEIFKAALRAKELVKQILTFSRQSDQEFKPTKIQSILKEVLKLLGSSIPATIDIQTDIDPDCGVVSADPTQIHQIIMNLATNAYHAMQESGGKLKIVLKQTKIESIPLGFSDFIPGEYALLKVIDTGTGIKKDILDKIFDPYFTTKVSGKGTGLGLSVVIGIVKSFNGDIHVYSESGKGTEIHVYLPIMKSASENGKHHPLKPIQGGTERILLVDDEEAIVKMEKLMLERLGYQVATRTGSFDALETFKANSDDFDLVITDMTMPNMTGTQLASEIKAVRTDIPIIICTGFSDQINEETSSKFNIQAFITKPLIKKEFAQIIRDVLDKSSEQSSAEIPYVF